MAPKWYDHGQGFSCLIENEELLKVKGMHAISYTVKVVISRKWCKIGTLLIYTLPTGSACCITFKVAYTYCMLFKVRFSVHVTRFQTIAVLYYNVFDFNYTRYALVSSSTWWSEHHSQSRLFIFMSTRHLSSPLTADRVPRLAVVIKHVKTRCMVRWITMSKKCAVNRLHILKTFTSWSRIQYIVCAWPTIPFPKIDLAGLVGVNDYITLHYITSYLKWPK